jgi:hypothetical protein
VPTADPRVLSVSSGSRHILLKNSKFFSTEKLFSI